MPKVGMEKVRKQQLIDATLNSIAEHGLQGTTIVTISKMAGVSSGIISHYFGGKSALLEATVRYLLEQLKQELLNKLPHYQGDHLKRLDSIIDANFANVQGTDGAAKTWLAFWTQSMHTPELSRLQQVNAARLEANLKYSLRQLIRTEQVNESAKMIASMIDGYWLRCALDTRGNSDFETAAESCKRFTRLLVERHANH